MVKIGEFTPYGGLVIQGGQSHVCKYKDKEWLERQYNRDDLEIKDIADLAGCGTTRIYKYLKAYQINQDVEGYEKYHNRNWFLREHVRGKKTLVELSEETGISRKILGIWREDLDIVMDFQKVIQGKKLCSNCRVWKDLDKFIQNSSTRSGYSWRCKSCIRTEEHLEQKREYQKQFRKDNPSWRIHHAIGEGIWRSLKEDKARKCWQDILNYNLQELKEHLKEQFKPGMSFDNYGEWHIDHIKPRSEFDIDGIDDPELKECWALDNLQPLWAEENLSKSDRVEGD